MNITKKLLKILVFFFIIGCASTENNIYYTDPRIKILDNGFWSPTIKIVNIISERNENNFLEVQVNGVNLSNNDEIFEYKIIWYNSKGFVIPTILSRWTKFVAIKNSEFNIRTIAPNSSAATFKILIRKLGG